MAVDKELERMELMREWVCSVAHLFSSSFLTTGDSSLSEEGLLPDDYIVRQLSNGSYTLVNE